MRHLRKSIVISVIALVAMNFPIPIFGQATIGIRGGVSRANVGGEGVDVDARTGIKVGASATIPIQDKFSLRLGGDYVQKGYGIEMVSISSLDLNDLGLDLDDLSFGGDVSLDYIELSGLGVVNLTPPESPASVYVLAGPAIGINVKCEAAGEDCGDDGLKTLDLGITGGIGTEMAISEGMTFSVELLYTLGLLSIDSEGEDIKNRAIALQVGVGFPIGK